jgi:hypothetical protein
MTVLLVTNGLEPGPTILRQSWAAGRIEAVDIYDLASSPFEQQRALWLTMNSDQRALQCLSDRLDGYLDQGGTVVFCGHVAWPFLPELTEFIPLRGYRLDDLHVKTIEMHPIWAGIDPDHLTFRRGVAGFYGRGYNPPPPGAHVLNAIAGGKVPVDWLVQRPGGGRLLVHAGNDLWSEWLDDTSANLLPRALLDWSLA